MRLASLCGLITLFVRRSSPRRKREEKGGVVTYGQFFFSYKHINEIGPLVRLSERRKEAWIVPYEKKTKSGK